MQTCPIPAIGAGSVLIRIMACGVNYSDCLIVQGKYQFKPAFPFSPGAEIAGRVEGVGKGVRGFKKGDAVVAATGWGGFSQWLSVPSEQVFHMPTGLSFPEAAASMVNYGTAFHALQDRLLAKPGESLCLLGAGGGIGTAAIQLGRAMKLRTITWVSRQEKSAYCMQQGASASAVYQRDGLKAFLMEHTQGKGADMVLDMVGGDLTQEAFRAMAYGGRYGVVGFASGHIPKLPLNLPLLKSASVVGVFWSRFRHDCPKAYRKNFFSMRPLFEKKILKPHLSGVYKARDYRQALHCLAGRKVLGKVVIDCSDEAW